jgi:hypothetical protein
VRRRRRRRRRSRRRRRRRRRRRGRRKRRRRRRRRLNAGRVVGLKTPPCLGLAGHVGRARGGRARHGVDQRTLAHVRPPL